MSIVWVQTLSQMAPSPQLSAAGGDMFRHVTPVSELNHAPGPANQQCVRFRQRTVVRPVCGAACWTHLAPPSTVVSTKLGELGSPALPTATHAETEPQPIDAMITPDGTDCRVQLAPPSWVAINVLRFVVRLVAPT